jgi:L-fuculokinase
MKKKIYAIFDIGKTNKKLLLFDENQQVIEEQQEVYAEIKDEDGFPCDDLARLTEGVLKQWERLKNDERYEVLGVNFTAYGASFVHLGDDDEPVAPLYNYLKPFPEALSEQFYEMIQNKFGQSKTEFAAVTCSPLMGLLNSGLQLYFLKYAKPAIFIKIKTSLHLPQYLSFLISSQKYSDFTSIGCHTALWDFTKNDYHDWVKSEGIIKKLAPITTCSTVDSHHLSPITHHPIQVGVGLHDSSSALLPYSANENEPFMLISTGTWCINLNSFNQDPLSIEQFSKDCLSYMTPQGDMTKASRVFFGREHDYQVERIAEYFKVEKDFYKNIQPNPQSPTLNPNFIPACMEGTGPTPQKQDKIWDLSSFESAETAYSALMRGLMDILTISIKLVDNGVKTFFVDGGFARNILFMDMLKSDFKDKIVKTLDVPQATALGGVLRVKRNVEMIYE